MPVGTQGTVKGLTCEMVRATGAAMLLGNTYHLALRPARKSWPNWAACIGSWAGTGHSSRTAEDSSCSAWRTTRKVREEGAVFRSHIDGRIFELSPERAVQIQEALGSDVAMVLDHVVPLPSPREQVRAACERSIRWARRCQDSARRPDQALFAIVQGGLDEELRVSCAAQLAAWDFAGYAVGGLSVGEGAAERNRVLDATCPALPLNRPRYLMGVGTPRDLLEAVRRGVDLFDCVLPTRNGRNAMAFSNRGSIRLRNAIHERDPRPLEEDCPCPACRHSRGYLRHLFQAREMLGPILLTAHNLTYYQRLLAEAREAIAEDRYLAFLASKLAGWADGARRRFAVPNAGRRRTM